VQQVHWDCETVYWDARSCRITEIKSTQNKGHDKRVQRSRQQLPPNATKLTKTGKATPDRMLNVSPYWQISIDVDAEIVDEGRMIYDQTAIKVV